MKYSCIFLTGTGLDCFPAKISDMQSDLCVQNRLCRDFQMKENTTLEMTTDFQTSLEGQKNESPSDGKPSSYERKMIGCNSDLRT